MLIRRAEVEGQHVDVRLASAQIQRIEPELAALPGESVLEAEGGALLPGLHDHHLHLFALAAALNSVRCGPPEVEDLAALSRALRAAAPRDGWVRGVGYHESVAGVLDRDVLDRIEAQRPVRVQHRSGALWCINSAGLARLEIDASTRAEGIERSPQGRVTGRLFRMDGWLRERLQVHAPPALDEASARLARYGVTGVTDATPGNAADALERLVEALESGALRQRVLLMGSHELPEAPHPELARGPVKLLLDERALPTFDWLCEEVRRAHDSGREVAVHCVTRTELVLVTAALREVGARAGDRIEHASVAPPDLTAALAELSLTVVTQPGFVHERGDAYLRDVEPADRPWLYRCRGLEAAGVALGAGTDAPFGDPDPWRAMRAAVERRTRSGASLGPDEAVTPERALGLFTSTLQAPGSAPRRVETGAAADLCLLDRPWSEARRGLAASAVRMTLRAGVPTWSREPVGSS